MFEMELKDVLKLADKLGIEYELDSDNPGVFIANSDGTEKEFTIEDILCVKENDDSQKGIDITITEALSSTKVTRTSEIKMESEYFQFTEFDEVA